MTNPLLDFGIDKSVIQYIGDGLQRPECILAERDGSLWAADARGGVVRIQPDGKQQIITQKLSGHFEGVANEATRYLEGTLPNGLALPRNAIAHHTLALFASHHQHSLHIQPIDPLHFYLLSPTAQQPVQTTIAVSRLLPCQLH